MEETRSVGPVGGSDASPGYPALRATWKALLFVVLGFAAVYFNFHLVAMAAHTLMPFVGLLAIGAVLGAFSPRGLLIPCFVAWWLVVLAVLLRRSGLDSMPLLVEIFDGELARAGYSDWAAWYAEVLRLGVYFWALWLGGKLGRCARRRS